MSSLICFFARAKQKPLEAGEPMPYVMIEDDMGTRLKNSVPADIDEKQLRVTLRKAADDHQYDAARDLLLSDYFWVEAYLMNGRIQSTVTAGRLRRYVPPKNANRKSGKWWDFLCLSLVGKTSSQSTFPKHVNPYVENILEARRNHWHESNGKPTDWRMCTFSH